MASRGVLVGYLSSPLRSRLYVVLASERRLTRARPGSRFVPPRKTENIGQLSYFQATTLIAPLSASYDRRPLSHFRFPLSLSFPLSPVLSFFSYVTFRIVYAAQTVRLRYIGCGSKAQGGGLLLQRGTRELPDFSRLTNFFLSDLRAK